jgi:hypothetical protein
MIIQKIRLKILFAFLPVVLSLASACTPAAAPAVTESASPAALPSAQVHLETLVLPTDTITPTATLALTATWTVTPGPTNSATPAAQFDKAQVLSVNNPVGGFLVSMRVPGLKTVLNILLETRKFTCSMDAKAPETLFCQGIDGPPIDRQISLVFVDPQSGAEVYKGTTYIIKAAVPTATPVGWASCPDRGKNIFCEVECRVYGGEPCIVATCNDACGPYFAVHTCPNDRPNDGLCSEEVNMELRRLYGIPLDSGYSN